MALVGLQDLTIVYFEKTTASKPPTLKYEPYKPKSAPPVVVSSGILAESIEEKVLRFTPLARSTSVRTGIPAPSRPILAYNSGCTNWNGFRP